MASNERMSAYALEVPAAAVEFNKHNQIGRIGIISQRMDVEPIQFGALSRLLQRRQIKIRLVIFGSSRK